ncbi:MAG: hypothetical protein RR147_02915 [Oscillospiraceae bacterium]
MPDKKFFVEKAKTASIVLLLISAIFLMFKAVLYEPNSLFGNFRSFFQSSSDEKANNPANADEFSCAADPLFILVTTEDGSHCAAKYNIQNKEKMLSQFSASLGEALGSSGKPKMITEEEWRFAISKSGVFFDYLYPQQLSEMAIWLGTQVTGGAENYSTRRIYLGSSGEKLYLYFISAKDNSIYRCETALNFSSISPKIAEFPMGNARFAFELNPEYENLDPYFIFSGENDEIRALNVSNPLRADFSADAMLSVFGMNSRAAFEYPEGDGSVVYLEGDKSLRIDVSGKVLFSVAGTNGIPVPSASDVLTIADCISNASGIVRNTIGKYCGEATTSLIKASGASYQSSYSLEFGYFVGGIPISLPNGAVAAMVQISGGSIVRAELNFREYTYSGELLLPMREKQAAAAVRERGGEPVLQYQDSASGVSAAWIIK